MNTFELDSIDKNKHIFFIGIGGISMSALAVILKNDGYKVCGSDFKQSDMTNFLCDSGINVFIGHNADNIKDTDLVVYTAAIKQDNPELLAAKQQNIPTIDRATLLGAIMKNYKYPVAVSGTHGKTTTTSMLTQVLLEAKKDPTILVGGILPSIGGNMRDGSKDYFVTEACEYCGSFLKFFPLISIILNVDEDHLDYFKDINDIIDCFHHFAQIPPKSGYVIVNKDDPEALTATTDIDATVLTFSITDSSSTFFAKNISYSDDGYGEYDAYKNGSLFAHIKLSIPGSHNILNSLSVLCVSDILGIDAETIRSAIVKFTGTNRRFEKKGTAHGAFIIDDYAHHPTEIKATLKAAKNVAKGKIYVVFQPHTYTRTYKLLGRFADSFTDCDNVIVTDIYAARENDTGLIHSKTLVGEINKISKNAVYVKEFKDIATLLKNSISDGDMVLTVGAGDVYKVGEMLLDDNETT